MWPGFRFPQVSLPGFRVVVVGLAVLCADRASVSPAAGQPSVSTLSPAEAERLLEQRGLTKMGTGALWVGRSEDRLIKLLGRVGEYQHNVERLEQQLREQIVRNKIDWNALEQARKQLKDAKGDAQKRTLKRTIKTLSSTCVKPQELVSRPEIQARLIELATGRDRLLLTILAARREFRDMPAEYKRLGSDRRIQSALDSLEQRARLGPARSYAEDMATLADAEKLVATDWLPLLQQSDLWRVNGVVNARAATTFTWEPGGGRVLLSGGVVELAGLSGELGNPVEMTVGKRAFTARRLRLPQLQLGACVLTDVDAFVLPPEAEDLGSRIGPKVFKGLDVRLDPQHLRLTIGDTP